MSTTIQPPTNIDAYLEGDEVVITWSKSGTTILGYSVYQNGEKVAFIPQIAPLFEFPFANESLVSPMLICSEISQLIYKTKINPFESTLFEIAALDASGESARIGITLIYQRYFEFTDVQITPNPVDVDRQFLINATIRDEQNLVVQ